MACSGLLEERTTVSGIRGVLSTLYPEVCRHRDTFGIFDREGCAGEGRMCRLCGTLVVQPLSRNCALC